MSSFEQPVLESDQLVCGYGRHAVLRNVSFTLGAGERVALLGVNGAGKSTLLKTLAGLIRPLGGEVRLLGANVQALRAGERARRVGYLAQEERSEFEFTVEQTVLMGRISHSEGLFETARDHEVARGAMRRTDALHLSERLAAELSGGERQRVFLARALAQEAPLLLLDEPAAHLDLGHQLALGTLLSSIAADGVAVVVAVHDLNFAARFAERALLVHGGGVLLDMPMMEALQAKDLQHAYGVSLQVLDLPGGGAHVVAAEAATWV